MALNLSLGGMTLEGSVNFKERELERVISTKPTSSDNENTKAISPKCTAILDPSKPKHEAAIKLQLAYKSFRTRRKLADSAVLLEHCWWKLLDFAELNWSSISFFDVEKHETAISRWSRARIRAAKVGKGLSKNDKALKLAFQHWLEAIDPRHRYGHNLHFYYDKWLHSQSKEPFFYWLDIGEGKEVNLRETCPRSKLQQQCVKYLCPMERTAYEVVVNDGKFLFKLTGKLLHTTGDAKWIFVLSTSKTLYVGQKKKGTFQHSSFLAGGAAIAAGMLVVENGVLKAVLPHSSHYRPTSENFKDFISFLRESNVDLTDVKMTAVEEESSIGNQRTSQNLRCSSSEENLAQKSNILEAEEINVKDLFGRLQDDHSALGPSCNDTLMYSLVEDGYRTSGKAFAPKQQMDCKENKHIDQESIPQRINSKRNQIFIIRQTVVLQMDNWCRTANCLCEVLSLRALFPGLGASELVSLECLPLKISLLSLPCLQLESKGLFSITL